jgi:hypothetical protein
MKFFLFISLFAIFHAVNGQTVQLAITSVTYFAGPTQVTKQIKKTAKKSKQTNKKKKKIKN